MEMDRVDIRNPPDPLKRKVRISKNDKSKSTQLDICNCLLNELFKLKEGWLLWKFKK